MLIVETIGRRREHLGKGKSIKEISRTLHLSRNTVRRILRSGETAFSYEREVQPRPKLGPWTEALDRLLTANAEVPARERLTLIRIYEELRRHCQSRWLAIVRVVELKAKPSSSGLLRIRRACRAGRRIGTRPEAGLAGLDAERP